MTNRYREHYSRLDRISASRLIYDDGALRIEGINRRSGSVVVELRFEDVLLIRITDEGVRLKLQRELGKTRAILFVDEQSELPAWLREESLSTRDFEGAKHYILFIGEEAFDVVALSEPVISEAPA